MRANLPKTSPDTGADTDHVPTELTGHYRQAMQEISARLMDKLPAGDDLWQTLAKSEALLLEAQMVGASLRDVFGPGGTAAFCQSIVDEFVQHHPEAAKPDAKRTVPAARDRSIDRALPDREPRGGINVRRKRRATVAMVTAFCVALLLFVGWYIGLLRYFTMGQGFYLEELYNFTSTATEISGEPLVFTVPLRSDTALDLPLYADDMGGITLRALYSEEHKLFLHDGSTDATILGTSYTRWMIRLTYPVDARFSRIAYTEPATSGTAILTFPDGTSRTFTVSAQSSGVAADGREYVVLTVLDLPTDERTSGATLTVTLDPPRRVVWKRISVGRR